MKLNTLYIYFAIILTFRQGFSQPTPYGETFLFNLLTEQQYLSKLLTVDYFKSKAIQFLTFDKETIVKYKTVNNGFSITPKGFETKHFAIVQKNIYISKE